MTFPEELRYSKDHEWVKVLDENTALVGITDFAQDQLGDIVFLDIATEGKTLATNEVFGNIEAVKTVSDLFLPMDGTIMEVNEQLANKPENINTDPYSEGWIVKVSIKDIRQLDDLMDVEAYKTMIGE